MIRDRLVALLCWLFLGTAGAAPAAAAASAQDLESMRGMALLLGRAIGCGLDTDRAVKAIGAWLDQTFPPGSAEQTRYLQAFGADVRQHARQQQSGDSPDSCADVADALKSVDW
jgi:hypothetical protein